MGRKLLGTLLALSFVWLCLGPVPVAQAQDLSFSVDREVVDVWINSDGSVSLEYDITFSCDPGADAIDVVDLGLPMGDFRISDISADVGGRSVFNIDSDYQGEGSSGVAIWLGSAAIEPGESGTLHVVVDRVEGLIYEDTKDDQYASMQFSPNYFGSQFTHGTTDLTVRIHLAPGVQGEEPRWHSSPSGWPQEQPEAIFDDSGGVLYTWNNPTAAPDQEYIFGVSFPRQYVPAEVIQRGPSLLDGVVRVLLHPVTLVVGFCALMVWITKRAQSRRRMAYLPPSMKVEGVGIKRGLTAVEAAIVLETPLNKVLTMILFGLLKKGAVTVLEDDPLQIQINKPLPEKLRPYEEDFLAAVKKNGTLREGALRPAMISLVQSVNNKMKGFSRKETMAYYQDIIRRAWEQVEGAETPEVRGERFGEGLEWTMLDEDFAGRTERTFRQGPVFVPMWWGYYRPWARTVPGGISPGRTSGGAPSGPIRLPSLPGADFAAGIVNGITGTAGKIVGSVTGFTGGVTKETNPAPVSSSGWSGGSGGSGGGCACACACACAGCACACAGGGR